MADIAAMAEIGFPVSVVEGSEMLSGRWERR